MVNAKSFYKNMPRGMHHVTTNINSGASPVDLDQLAVFGNRAQRRFAKKEIARLVRERSSRGSLTC